MRQHLKTEEVKADLLIVGGGLAGCWAAIKGKELIDNVVLVDKGHVAFSGQSIFAATHSDPPHRDPQRRDKSALALLSANPQSFKSEYPAAMSLLFPEDDIEAWLKELIEGGEYLNDQEWVKVQFKESFGQAIELEKVGESCGLKLFEKDEKGDFLRKRIGQNVIASHIDAVAMMQAVRKKIVTQRTSLIERVMVTDLVLKDGRVVGAVGLDYRRGKLYLFKTRGVILAAAGCGFKTFMMGAMNLTGEAQAMAYNAGAALRNMEQAGSLTTPKAVAKLGISRAMSYGARLLNGRGEEFLKGYDPFGRTRRIRGAIYLAKEVRKGNGPIYLDLSPVTAEGRRALESAIPETLRAFKKVGIDPFQDRIEVTPTFLGSNAQSGGIHVDTRCATNLPGLYAIGDSTCCPVQGTWPVSGINLPFCLVSGARAAQFAAEYVMGEGASLDWEGIKRDVNAKVEALVAPLDRGEGFSPDEATFRLQEIILPYDVSLLREERGLKEALEKLEEVKERVLPGVWARELHELAKAIEVRSMVTISDLILKSALYRKESRGFHYREDYPLTDNNDWLRWVKVSKDDGVWADPFPTPYLEPAKERYQPR